MIKTLVSRGTPEGIRLFWKVAIPLISDISATHRDWQKSQAVNDHRWRVHGVTKKEINRQKRKAKWKDGLENWDW